MPDEPQSLSWSAQDGGGPRAYEEFLVPAMFDPLAVRVADLLDVRHGATFALNVACGTGALTRELARRLGPEGAVTGTDAGAPSGVRVGVERIPTVFASYAEPRMLASGPIAPLFFTAPPEAQAAATRDVASALADLATPDGRLATAMTSLWRSGPGRRRLRPRHPARRRPPQPRFAGRTSSRARPVRFAVWAESIEVAIVRRTARWAGPRRSAKCAVSCRPARIEPRCQQ